MELGFDKNENTWETNNVNTKYMKNTYTLRRAQSLQRVMDLSHTVITQD